jgi:hypothetical protein
MQEQYDKLEKSIRNYLEKLHIITLLERMI